MPYVNMRYFLLSGIGNRYWRVVESLAGGEHSTPNYTARTEHNRVYAGVICNPIKCNNKLLPLSDKSGKEIMLSSIWDGLLILFKQIFISNTKQI